MERKAVSVFSRLQLLRFIDPQCAGARAGEKWPNRARKYIMRKSPTRAQKDYPDAKNTIISRDTKQNRERKGYLIFLITYQSLFPDVMSLGSLFPIFCHGSVFLI